MKYFTIQELVRSNTATKKGIDNSPTDAIKKNLSALVDNVLDPLREAYGKPITISSGYRCDELNKAVGGSSTSEHRIGAAADINGTPDTKEENMKLFNMIQELGLPFRQLIWEHGGDWVHVSFRTDTENKKQVLSIG